MNTKVNFENVLFLDIETVPEVENFDDLSIEKKEDDWYLVASLIGNNIGPEIHLKHEIKAITFHQMNIKKLDNVFSTLLVFDI